MAYDTTFLDELASSASIPGGGGASAYVGAIAAALSSMVGNLTTGKKTYAAVEDQVQARLAGLETKRAHLLDLVQADADAFGPLSDCYRMPKNTEEELAARNAALQAALTDACLVPLNIMRAAADIVEEADWIAHNGTKMAVSDAGASAYFAQAAVRAASLNVYINTGSMDDKEQAAKFEAEADELIAKTDEYAASVCAFVMGKIR